LLAKIARADVLVLDDWAIAPITDTERRDLLEDSSTATALARRS